MSELERGAAPIFRRLRGSASGNQRARRWLIGIWGVTIPRAASASVHTWGCPLDEDARKSAAPGVAGKEFP
jgi:hypothetical protein